MKLLLRVQDLCVLDNRATWWQDTSYLHSVLQALDKVGLLREFSYYGLAGAKRHKIDSLTSLLKASASFQAKSYSLVTQNVETPSARLDLDFNTGALTLHLVFEPVFWRDYQGNLLSQLIDLVTHMHDTLENRAMWGPLVNVEIIGALYPRVRPLRYHSQFVFGTLVHIISKNFNRFNNAEEIAKVLAAPLPDDVQRVEHGDLVIFRWAEDIKDARYIAQRRSAQEQWLVRVINPPLHPNYNAAGDFLVMPVGTVGPDATLTRYDAVRKYGYKAVVVFPDGRVDEALFLEMPQWIQQRRLPDGRELQALYLITPSRTAAVWLHERARQIGVKATYYVDNQGQLWDPFPPGPWLEPESALENQGSN